MGKKPNEDSPKVDFEGNQSRVIATFRSQLMDGNEKMVDSIDALLRGIFEDSPLSYIITRQGEKGSPIVIASTKIFRDAFFYSNDELIGLNSLSVLNVPEIVFPMEDLANLLASPDPQNFSISIYDRKRNECVAYVLKGNPGSVDVFPSFFPTKRGVRKNYNCIEIYRVAEVTRNPSGGVKSIKYNRVKKPSTLCDLRVNECIDQIMAMKRTERDKIVHWNLKKSKL